MNKYLPSPVVRSVPISIIIPCRCQLWSELAKLARKKQLWDIALLASRLCLAYDDKRWNASPQGTSVNAQQQTAPHIVHTYTHTHTHTRMCLTLYAGTPKPVKQSSLRPSENKRVSIKSCCNFAPPLSLSLESCMCVCPSSQTLIALVAQQESHRLRTLAELHCVHAEVVNHSLFSLLYPLSQFLHLSFVFHLSPFLTTYLS